MKSYQIFLIVILFVLTLACSISGGVKDMNSAIRHAQNTAYWIDAEKTPAIQAELTSSASIIHAQFTHDAQERSK